jgi:hypothetical protein
VRELAGLLQQLGLVAPELRVMELAQLLKVLDGRVRVSPVRAVPLEESSPGS